MDRYTCACLVCVRETAADQALYPLNSDISYSSGKVEERKINKLKLALLLLLFVVECELVTLFWLSLFRLSPQPLMCRNDDRNGNGRWSLVFSRLLFPSCRFQVETKRKRGTEGRFLKRKPSRRKCRKWNNIIPWLSFSSFCGHNTYHSFVLFPLHC